MAEKIANLCRIVKGFTFLLMGTIVIAEGIGSLTRLIKSYSKI